jgi:hypothetical protein
MYRIWNVVSSSYRYGTCHRGSAGESSMACKDRRGSAVGVNRWQFPVVGDAVNKAVQHVATGRQSARDAMDAAQQKAIGDRRKAENQL